MHSLSLLMVHDMCGASENQARVTECQRATMVLTNSRVWETVVNENYICRGTLSFTRKMCTGSPPHALHPYSPDLRETTAGLNMSYLAISLRCSTSSSVLLFTNITIVCKQVLINTKSP